MIRDLANKRDKDSRIKLNKINDYIGALENKGLSLKEPYIKKISHNIWELRPLRYRILFTLVDDYFLLLHYFIKSTNKTPIKEIEKAKKEIENFLGGKCNE